MFLFEKLFQGYIFCFLGDSFGRYVFEQYARETNLKKKRSVWYVAWISNFASKSSLQWDKFLYGGVFFSYYWYLSLVLLVIQITLMILLEGVLVTLTIGLAKELYVTRYWYVNQAVKTIGFNLTCN